MRENRKNTSKNIAMSAFFMLAMLSSPLWAQRQRIAAGQDTTQNPIITSVPFLLFAPDARSASMGDVGVATRADVNSIHWNNAKIPFVEAPLGVAMSYTPWLAELVDDMYIGYLSSFYRLTDLHAVGVSFRYFSLGDIFLTTETGSDAGTFSPRDFSLDGTYARKLSPTLGVGVTLRYVYSNLSKSYEPGNSGDPAQGVALDLGFFYTNPDLNFSSRPLTLALGAHISNVGTKITYDENGEDNFMPANLRLGVATTLALTDDHSFTTALDFNKLLVPTPPIYKTEGNRLVTDEDGNPAISSGKDPDRTVINALFSSFGDAPDGFREELREVSLGFGMEYWFREVFSLQAGYHHESKQKGNRKYYTLGAGFRYSVAGIDLAYLVPTTRNHPLAQTLRFTVLFDIRSTALTDASEPTDTSPAGDLEE